MQEGNRKLIQPLLVEVSFIRPILILLLVLYHALCIHTGRWTLPDGVTFIPAYKAIARIIYAFMLETFVFISGYVWAYQYLKRGDNESFSTFFIKKTHRLMLPSLVFGFFYILIFGKTKNNVFVYLLEGPGHLWFLPMLFECFIIGWFIVKSKIPRYLIFSALFLLAIFHPDNLPIRLSQTFYYLPFFMLGFYVYTDAKFKNFLKKYYYVIGAWLCFFVCYSVMVVVRRWLIANVDSAFIIGGCKNFCVIIYSLCGTIALFSTSVFITEKIKLKEWYISLGGACMGTYIFQQFVLKYLYYKTDFAHHANNYIMPFSAFLIALVVSLLLTILLRKIKFIRSIL